MEGFEAWMRAVEQTYVVKFPSQHLATFGTTIVEYFVVTEPVYKMLDAQQHNTEGVVRKGKVFAEKPALITPTYAMNLDGFSSDAYEYMEHMSRVYGPNSPGIMYQYRNEPGTMDIVGGIPNEIAQRISDEQKDMNNNLSVVIVGVDELWDVALLKFIYEYTASSVSYNSQELQSAGLLTPQASAGGLPAAAANQIEVMFKSVKMGGSVDTLKSELDKWGAYRFYEDRFLDLFK